MPTPPTLLTDSETKFKILSGVCPDSPINRDLHTDLVIVGAGIVGATLACGLLESGLQVTLIEAKPTAVGLNNRRAYALTLLTREIFTHLGLWSSIEPRITPFKQIRLSDGHHPGIVQFSPQDLKQDLQQDVLGYVGEHSVVLEALYDRLAQAPNLRWICPAEVVAVSYGDDRAWVTFREDGDDSPEADGKNPGLQMLSTSLVVAADGSQSPLRQGAGIGTKGWKYWQSCIGFRVRTEKPHQNIAYERFWPSGPFAILPLPGNRCQVVWTAPHAEAQRLAALPEAEFIEALYQRYGHQMGQVELDGPRMVFPVKLMQSDRYGANRLILVGDAAHCCHPVGGQGMNLGIRDAAALTEILLKAQATHQDMGSGAVLRSYERWRQRENLTILGFTDLLDRLFSNRWLPLVGLRRLGLWCLRHVVPIRLLALRLMTGQLGRKPRLICGER
jgi:2-octaprenyl-6-methoxyphenol hydroxylase